MRPALLEYIEEMLITTLVVEGFVNRIRVMIVNNHSLLMDGVESLLRANGQFEVVSTTASNLADFSRENKHFEPNIVIIDEAMTFIKPAHLITSLPGTSQVRLIMINSRTTKLEIYDKSKLSVSTVDHFLDAIRNETAQYLNKFPGNPTH